MSSPIIRHLESIVITGILLIGIIFLSGCTTQTLTTTTTTQVTQTLITKSLAEMLPTRADIPTEFVISGAGEDATLNAAGFESGGGISTNKLEGTGGMIFVDYYVYKFSTSDYAKSYYDSRIDEIKQAGGYKEINIASCFAYKEDYGFYGENGESICLKNNVVYGADVDSSQTYKQIDSFMKDATNILTNKVSQ